MREHALPSAAALWAPEITSRGAREEGVFRMTIRGNSKCANVIVSANGQSAVQFWGPLHLGLIKYQEAGSQREGPLGEATPDQQDPSGPTYHVWKAPEEMKVGGSARNHTLKEEVSG